MQAFIPAACFPLQYFKTKSLIYPFLYNATFILAIALQHLQQGLLYKCG